MSSSADCIDRRGFLRTAALGIAAAPVLSGWTIRLPARSRVALVRTADRASGVTRALQLLDVGAVRDRRVLIKPNFNTADPAPGSTHNDTLAQLIAELHERGARSITIGESSGPPNTRSVMEQKGIFDLARDHRFDIVNFDEMPDADWVHVPATGMHWPEGFYLPRPVTTADYLVSTCCLKTHGAGGVFTMSLKLAVGLTPKPSRRGMHRSADMRRMIAELNTGYRPDLIVLDGVAAFTDGGPSRGEVKQANVVIAGTDRVAVDAVGVAVLKELGSNRAIMDRHIFEQEQIARAVELRLGARSSADIEIVTGDAESRTYAAKLEAILALG